MTIIKDSYLHVDGSDGMKLTAWESTMTQRVDSKRKDVADGFFVHISAASRSTVIIYSYAARPVLEISL
jgi:hypothetical protein